MSRKIIGVTVGTNLNPKRLEEYVQDGKSAYELAVENGFKGTEKEWLASLNGKDGRDGYTPIKGVDYFDGINGKEGYTPVKGKDYFDGNDGYTPTKGIDYFTEEDVREIAGHAAEMVDVPKVPSKLSELDNDAGFITADDIPESGVTSWNDIEDKPFSEAPPLFDIAWDGNMDGHDTFGDEESAYLVKVSDEVYTAEQILGSTIYYHDGYNEVVLEEYVNTDIPGVLDMGDVLIVYSVTDIPDEVGAIKDLPSNGVWFINAVSGGYYVNRFVAPHVIQTIDEKYIPDTIARTSDIPEVPTKVSELENDAGFITADDIPEGGDGTVSWNDLEDKPFEDFGISWVQKVNVKLNGTETSVNIILTAVLGKNYKLEVINEWTGDIVASYIAPCFFDSKTLRYLIKTNTDIVYADGGTSLNSWTIYTSVNTALSPKRIIISEETIIPLNEKYIPDTIARKSDIPESVTSWNDLEDKPFGEDETSWNLVASGEHLLGSTVYEVTMNFTAVVGRNYKLEFYGIEGIENNIVAIVTAPCTAFELMPGYKVYYIGESGSGAYGQSNNMNKQWTFYSVETGTSGLKINVYEEVESVTTLDEKYISETIARKTDIPTKVSELENDAGYLTEDDIIDIPSGGSSTAIIDVVELPTENINEQVFYRKLTGTFMFGKVMNNSTTCHCVNGLPEVGEPCTNADMTTIIVYYNTEDELAYGYVDDVLSGAMGVPAGWYEAGILFAAVGFEYGGVITNINDVQEDEVFRLLLEYAIYSYKDGWKSIESLARPGEGDGSVVIGTSATATGYFSFAAGSGIATGNFATALGWGEAEGDESLAVGEACARGFGSFAIGSGVTSATGEGSFAQTGQGSATGYYSFARGIEATAQGDHSFANGAQVYANGKSQFVYGQANIVDRENKYLHIVGNGKTAFGPENDGVHEPSNAHTLDWSGNAWFQGDVYVGGVGQDDTEAKKLATTAYVDSLIGTGVDAITNDEIDEICSLTLNTYLDTIAAEEVSF